MDERANNNEPYDWDDRLSWDDSDRFDEDSIGSWLSEPESVCQNWRGWQTRAHEASKAASQSFALSYTGGISNSQSTSKHNNHGVPSLLETAARVVARTKPFEAVEEEVMSISLRYEQARTPGFSIPSCPVDFQMRIAYWCFPEVEEDIRLYSCLANGNAEEFQRGEQLYKNKSVKDLLQIGFHLSATVNCPATSGRQAQSYDVAVTVDRCCHVVALCLHRINWPDSVRFRSPVRESLNRLGVDQLRKFAQFFISQLPRQYLPTAQGLLDQLLSADSYENNVNGAPDPTAGAHWDDSASWCMDVDTLHENIRKILIKFCVPSPTVFSDVNYLSSSLPPAANEWISLLRPLRGREPEGLWNLLSIVREMYRRHDANATALLHIITEECISCDQVVAWWYVTRLSQSGTCPIVLMSSTKSSIASNQFSAQYSCSSLCDELVELWRLAALNPTNLPNDRTQLKSQLVQYHVRVVEKVWKLLNSNQEQMQNSIGSHSCSLFGRLTPAAAKFDLIAFCGFSKAIQACLGDWTDYTIEGLSTQLQSPRESGTNSSLSASNMNLSSECAAAKQSCSPILPVLRDKTYSCSQNRKVTPRPEKIKIENENDGQSSESGQESVSSRNDSFDLEGDNLNSSEVEAVSPNRVRNSPEACGLPEPVDEVAALYMFHDPIPEQEKRSQVVLPRKERNVVQDVQQLIDSIEPISEQFEIMFCRCESLWTHGYLVTACDLAKQLAEYLLENPPQLLVELPPNVPAPPPVPTPSKGVRRKKSRTVDVPVLVHSKALQNSAQAAGTLCKSIFLFHVLVREPGLHALAFRVGLFALELPRQPAATRSYEVKMNHYESEIVNLLKGLMLEKDEMQALRDRANFIKQGLKQHPLAALPFSLANFVFESLCFNPDRLSAHRLPSDEQLGFEAAIASLAMRNTFSEAEHPLLCEGTRRQRGDLALALLLRYKDKQDKLALIMDRLLDPEMHQMYRHHATNAAFYSPNSRGTVGQESPRGANSGIQLPPAAPSAPNLLVPCAAANVVRHSSEDSEQSSRQEDSSDRNETNSSAQNNTQDSLADAASDSSSSGISRGLPAAIHTNDTSLTPSASASNAASPPPNASAAPPQKPESLTQACHLKLSNRNRRHVSPLLPNQASESQAHFMTELAKRLLTEAGGNHSTAIFNAPQNGPQPNQQHNLGPHRSLHLCAFQIGLYALGLHNKVNFNWLSRTYSSHVSWISGQALEIGRAAIRILIDTWNNHLTPTEVAALADKASQGREPGMVQAAADLALSVLPHAHALNPQEIQRSLAQCKEQNTHMLEKACLAVEQAAQSAGVYPEVLFMVAKQWHQLYQEKMGQNPPVNMAQQTPPAIMHMQMHHPPPQVDLSVPPQAFQGIVPTQYAHMQPFPINPPILMPPPGVPHSQAAAVYAQQQLMALLAPQQNAANPQVLYQPPFSSHQSFLVRPTYLIQQNSTGMVQYPHLQSTPLTVQQARPGLHASVSAPNLNHAPRGHHYHAHAQLRQVGPSQANQAETDQSRNLSRLLESAWRVGMLAMQTMKGRIHDERSYSKYAQNPLYGDDVKWLFKITKQLGHIYYIQDFCSIAEQSVVSPFILWELAVETAQIFSPAPLNPSVAPQLMPQSASMDRQGGQQHLMKQLMNPCVQPLLQRCLQMFRAAAQSKLSHPKFMPSDAEDVLALVRAARTAFHHTPNGATAFQEFLHSLRRMKAMKKDLWSKLMTDLSQS